MRCCDHQGQGSEFKGQRSWVWFHTMGQSGAEWGRMGHGQSGAEWGRARVGRTRMGQGQRQVRCSSQMLMKCQFWQITFFRWSNLFTRECQKRRTESKSPSGTAEGNRTQRSDSWIAAMWHENAEQEEKKQSTQKLNNFTTPAASPHLSPKPTAGCSITKQFWQIVVVFIYLFTCCFLPLFIHLPLFLLSPGCCLKGFHSFYGQIVAITTFSTDIDSVPLVVLYK